MQFERGGEIVKKKIAVFIVFSAAAILIACMIHHGTQKPYHYEGIIKSIDVDENGNAFLETESVHGEALIKIVIYCNQKIPYWDGSYLQPAELQIGFVMDADFAKQKEGDYYTLKRMVVFPSVLSAPRAVTLQPLQARTDRSGALSFAFLLHSPSAPLKARTDLPRQSVQIQKSHFLSIE